MGLLNAAVVGLGVGEQHARAFARAPGAALRWVLDLDPAKASRVAADVGQGAPAESFEAILADPQTHIVSIATYDDQHAEQVVRALEAGKHVFCEKPLCNSLEQLARIRAAMRASGKHLACNLVLRSAPLYVWLRGAIQAGELGDVYAFDGDYLYGRIHKITEGWRGDIEDYSVTQGGGVHLVDLMTWLTGLRARRVVAAGNKIATRDTKFRGDDFVAATFELERGAIGRITSNFGCVHRHQHVVRVFGTKATFLYDDRGARLHTTRSPDAAPIELAQAPLPASKGELISAFVKKALDDIHPADEHEFEVMAACLAVDRSVREGPVPVEYP